LPARGVGWTEKATLADLRATNGFVADVGPTVFGQHVACEPVEPGRTRGAARSSGSPAPCPVTGSTPTSPPGSTVSSASSGRDGFVDLSHRDVVRVSGPDRLIWLHSLTTQFFLDLPAGVWTEALILSPQGHVEHAFSGVDDGEAFTAHTDPGQPGEIELL
jgi:hypothetical protein